MRLLVTLLIILALVVAIYTSLQSPQTGVSLQSPPPGSAIQSPLVIKGEAHGNWFFEANIIVELQDNEGNQLAIIGATATEDWMTTELVPFEGIMNFETDAESGYLIVRNDNASGLPEHDKSQVFPVVFQ